MWCANVEKVKIGMVSVRTCHVCFIAALCRMFCPGFQSDCFAFWFSIPNRIITGRMTVHEIFYSSPIQSNVCPMSIIMFCVFWSNENCNHHESLYIYASISFFEFLLPKLVY